MGWLPFSVRLGKKRPEFDGLQEGVPAYLLNALIEWLNKYYFFDSPYLDSPLTNLNIDSVKEAGLLLRIPLDWSGGAHAAHASLIKSCTAKPDLFLDLLDLALHRTQYAPAPVQLQQLLVDGGSAYDVAPSGDALTRRVPDGVREAAEEAMRPDDRAAKLLKESWAHVYGRHPNPAMGYREAIRAVESVACPIVLPNDKLATLGKVIKRLTDAPDKFTSVLQGPGADAVGTVRGMMAAIWKSQLDRHGTADENAPLHVSQDEAEAALQIAVALVQWFRRGFIRVA